MFLRIIKALWGDLTRQEYKKFGILAAAMMLIIGNYWMLRVTKDPLFELFVGFAKYQPVIKIISSFVILFLVLGYSKLVDLLKKQVLIYTLSAFYGFAFISLSFLIANPNIATISQTSIFYPLVSWIPGKGIGWFAYFLLESYGSLLIALFYSFIASVMNADLAKKGYGFMFALIQVSTVIGIFTEMYVVKTIGFSTVYFIGGILVLIAPFFIKLYLSVFKNEVTVTQDIKKSEQRKTGFFEGLRLIITHPYVLGILVVASFYEIIHTILEYQMGCAALSVYTGQPHLFAVFKGYQGLATNILSFSFAFFGGTSIFMRKFGLKFCLVSFPISIGVVVLICAFSYLSGIGNQYLMWILLGSCATIRGLSYTLNKPTSEVMYIPTSKDIKFKAKSWIDMFGLREAKSLGGAINLIAPMFLFGSIISLGVVGVWVFVAAFVGNKFNQLQKDKQIIE